MVSASLFFFVGLAVLLASGELLVRSALAIAKRVKISPLAAGLTLTAIATSAPEAFVSVEAVLNNAPGIALGNVIGSNIANLLLVLGVPALLFSFSCHAPMVRRNALFAGAAVLLLFPLGWRSPLGVPEGAFLLMGAVFYLIYILHIARQRGIPPDALDISTAPTLYGKSTAFLLLIAAALGLHFGAEWLLEGAKGFASLLALPPAIIALSLIALGTSLPELAATLAAARKGHSELAVGNILGSNILNIFGILGLSALLGAIPIPAAFISFDMVILTAVTLGTLPFFLLRARIPRVVGGLFLFIYAAYLYSLIGFHGADFLP